MIAIFLLLLTAGIVHLIDFLSILWFCINYVHKQKLWEFQKTVLTLERIPESCDRSVHNY